MIEADRKIRERALREAAGIARVWIASYADLDNSSNPQLAKMFASVASHTGSAIEKAILKLIDQEPTESKG